MSTVALALSSASVTGCAPRSPDDKPTSPATESTSPGGGSGNGKGNNGKNGGGGKKDEPWLIRWITDLGPGGPGGGEDYGWIAYGHLQRRECAQSLDSANDITEAPRERLYVGASHACLAALDGETNRWEQAEAALEAAEAAAGSANYTCYDQSVLTFLKTLVDLHRKDPERRFSLANTGSASTKCLRLFRLKPSHGPSSGGYEVKIIGQNLDHMSSDYGIQVEHDGVNQRVRPASMNSSGTELTFVMPSFSGEGKATVLVYGDRGEALLEFTFEAG